MDYLKSLYDSGRATLVCVCLALDDKFPVNFGSQKHGSNLVPSADIPSLEVALSGTNGHYTEASNSQQPYGRLLIPWSGFYPRIDAKKPGHANLYRTNGYKSRLAHALYAKRDVKKHPVDISKT